MPMPYIFPFYSYFVIQRGNKNTHVPVFEHSAYSPRSFLWSVSVLTAEDGLALGAIGDGMGYTVGTGGVDEHLNHNSEQAEQLRLNVRADGPYLTVDHCCPLLPIVSHFCKFLPIVDFVDHA